MTECNSNSNQCGVAHIGIITHNLIDSCEFSSRQFGPGGGSWWGHQGSSCQWGCRSVWYRHYTEKEVFTG